MKGLISEIQKSSVHDGPGFRTVVFMKGCNMRCAWCHNPETVYSKEEMLYDPGKCIGCGQCESGCYGGARIKSGKTMNIEQVLEIIREDRPYYKNQGGVTLSGGEPLCQIEFAEALLTQCRNQGIHTALETNLNFDLELVLRAGRLADLIMCDCKIYDEELHRHYTGCSNGKILRNILELDQLGIPILVRTPVIQGVNCNENEIHQIAGHLSGMKNLLGYELLTYHPLGLSKPNSEHFVPVQFEKPSKEEMRSLARTAGTHGLRVFVDNIIYRREDKQPCCHMRIESGRFGRQRSGTLWRRNNKMAIWMPMTMGRYHCRKDILLHPF